MAIHQRIFQTLKQKGLTQQQMSDATGIPSRTISAWKSTPSNPSATLIPVIAGYLCVSCAYLLTGRDELFTLDDETQELLHEWSKLSKRDKRRVEVYIYELQDKDRIKVNEQEREDA